MLAEVAHHGETFRIDLSAPIDISIPLRAGEQNVNAWYVSPMDIQPVRSEQFTGSVAEGGTVNFRDITFNPHGNGTHTECIGHITPDVYSINRILTKFWFTAEVITILPDQLDEDLSAYRQKNDRVITAKMLAEALGPNRPEALIIRTLPNVGGKINRQYNNTNWPYLLPEAAEWLNRQGIDHLLIDLPSVDREFDGGAMLAHRAFWDYPNSPQMQRTITELIYVDDEVADGRYLLNLQISSFENDASPSKPILYKIEA